jgi:hypothetical protein
LAAGLQNQRVKIDLDGLRQGITLDPSASRLALNLLLLAGESLPAGGIAALSSSPEDGLLTTISGPRAAWPRGLYGCLADSSTAYQAAQSDPRRVQGPLTVLLAKGLGYRLSMLMPAGARGEANRAPPLLLTLAE